MSWPESREVQGPATPLRTPLMGPDEEILVVGDPGQAPFMPSAPILEFRGANGEVELVKVVAEEEGSDLSDWSTAVLVGTVLFAGLAALVLWLR